MKYQTAQLIGSKVEPLNEHLKTWSDAGWELVSHAVASYVAVTGGRTSPTIFVEHYFTWKKDA